MEWVATAEPSSSVDMTGGHGMPRSFVVSHNSTEPSEWVNIAFKEEEIVPSTASYVLVELSTLPQRSFVISELSDQFRTDKVPNFLAATTNTSGCSTWPEELGLAGTSTSLPISNPDLLVLSQFTTESTSSSSLLLGTNDPLPMMGLAVGFPGGCGVGGSQSSSFSAEGCLGTFMGGSIAVTDLQKSFPVYSGGTTSSQLQHTLDSSSRGSLNSSYSGGVVTEIVTADVQHNFLASAFCNKRKGSVATSGGASGTKKSETKAGLVECPFCKKNCSKPSDLRAHLRTHTGQKPFQCIVCGRAFSQNCNVRKHLESHKVWPHIAPLPVREHQEKDNSNADLTNANLQNDQRLRVGPVPSDCGFKCPYCPEAFSSFLCFRSHLPKHCDQKLYQCSLRSCRKLFVELQELLSHLKLHDGLLTYQCPTCENRYNSLHDVGVHQFSHSLEPISSQLKKQKCPTFIKRPYRCFECGDRFASAEALDRHKAQSSHNYACSHCTVTFRTARLLRAHLSHHVNISLERYRCLNCTKLFKSANALNVHAQTHKPAKHQCGDCGKSFHRAFLLKRHSESLHKPAKFACQQCNRQFKRADRYKNHLKIHAKSTS